LSTGLQLKEHVVGNPEHIEVTAQVAAMRQIHAAIEHLHRGDFECAITLGAAAEGMLPPTDKPHLFEKIKALRPKPSLNNAEADGANDMINWLKHGVGVDGKRVEKATISELEMMVTVTRAISKFAAIYDGLSPQMKGFTDWSIARLQGDEKAN
jgi:hypothetical protein